MRKSGIHVLQAEKTDRGALKINVESALRTVPVENATVDISYTGEPDQILEEVRTDQNGNTGTLELKAPPLEYSMQPGETQPYSEYTIKVSAEGYEPVTISGSEVMSGELSLQNIRLRPLEQGRPPEVTAIPPHTLYGNYPPKIAEAEIKPVNQSGEIVLRRVVIPEYVVVHDGSPRDTTAGDYYVRYKDYIKNVASSEIYSTWPKETIIANVLAIMSFTLNRVYTEWYRNKGFDFTITSSTAFDHKWIYGRNIFESISEIVDEIFENYLSRPNVKQPILTQYCDGSRVTCPQWMSQWGSKALGDQGYSAIEILRSFYGNDMYINVAEAVSGIPASWPGYDLTIGVTGEKVQQIQEQLNAIAKAYPAIPSVIVDGIYGPATVASVKKFQNIFGLPASGVVDYPTWYKIQDIYVAVTRIAELQ